MPLYPHLAFNGNAEEALEFYRDAFGGRVEIVRFEGAPGTENSPPEWRNKVLHGVLDAPDLRLMAMDAPPAYASNPGDNVFLAFHTEDEAQARTVFDQLSAGGNVTMPFEQTFWAAKFGMLTDKFGMRWMVNCQPAPVSA